MVVILMGVAGAGKTTIGQLLATDLGWRFYDGDEFHPQANIDKMRQGIALIDDDRDSWLAALQHLIHKLLCESQPAVIACSALKQSYRDRLLSDKQEVRFVYLKGDYDLIRKRLQERQGHFMKANLLTSQFDTLEEPEGALTVDVAQEPQAIVSLIRRELGLSKTEVTSKESNDRENVGGCDEP
ncbi:MAG: gluconokinase [Deltaproteobacteria bacterium]|nr:gluconokinase [Deltaproteobacteria bacterium]